MPKMSEVSTNSGNLHVNRGKYLIENQKRCRRSLRAAHLLSRPFRRIVWGALACHYRPRFGVGKGRKRGCLRPRIGKCERSGCQPCAQRRGGGGGAGHLDRPFVLM